MKKTILVIFWVLIVPIWSILMLLAVSLIPIGFILSLIHISIHKLNFKDHMMEWLSAMSEDVKLAFGGMSSLEKELKEWSR